ncbi:MAG: hypothetical protein AAGB26_11325 [Planctomycetota bacterium]
MDVDQQSTTAFIFGCVGVVGQKLGLYTIDNEAGQRLVLCKPKGAVIRDELNKFIIKHLERQGYQQVFTPHIGKLGLFRITSVSGPG